jgi:pSer/pThr/pTyr-binding forkhead associated (FHA) protein
MKVSLVVMNPGKTEGHAIPITLSQFIIGRDPQCNLRPASPVISKRHCAILVKNGKVTLRDFDSTNGTFIGENQVKGEVPLDNDNILKVGPLTFKVVIERPVTVEKPTPPPAKKLPGSEDDVANMLLSLQEDDVETADEEPGNVPGGSTVMDVKAMPAMTTTLTENPKPIPPPAKSVTPPPVPKAQKSITPPPVAKSATPPPPQKSATPPPPTMEAQPEPEPEREVYPRPEVKKPEEKKPDDKKPPAHASARDAAKAILEKMYKRPRGSG